MIKIELKDNLYDIIKKIQNNSWKIVEISIPIGHKILYNKYALWAIKEFFKDKKIIIFTNDIISRKLLKELGFKYTSNKNILQNNYSFFEYLWYEIKKFFPKKKNNFDPRKKFLKFYKQKYNFKFFSIILVISFLIFLYLFFFIFNKTYVEIIPEYQVKNYVKNFIFTEKNNNIFTKDIIWLKKFEVEVQLKEKINTTWIKQSLANRARWEILLVNKLPQDIKLRSHTRLKAPNGVIYELTNWVKIPKAKKNKNNTLIPWTIKAEIIAKERNYKWELVGSKWNFFEKNVIFTIPGLDSWLQDKIFATTIWAIKWWKDIFEKVVAKDDIKNAKKFFIEELQKQAIKKIRQSIQDFNTKNSLSYKILQIDNIFEFSDLKVNLPNLNQWDKIDSFEISWSIKLKTYAFNSQELISKIKNEIKKYILEDKESLLYINTNQITIFPKIWVIYRQNNPVKIKASVEVEYVVEYNFENNNSNYIKRLKQLIAGLPKQKAEKILINEDKISNAKIRIRPFFIKNVSKYPSNIYFSIEK